MQEIMKLYKPKKVLNYKESETVQSFSWDVTSMHVLPELASSTHSTSSRRTKGKRTIDRINQSIESNDDHNDNTTHSATYFPSTS